MIRLFDCRLFLLFLQITRNAHRLRAARRLHPPLLQQDPRAEIFPNNWRLLNASLAPRQGP